MKLEFIGLGSTTVGLITKKNFEKKARESTYVYFFSCVCIHCSDEDRCRQLKKDQHNLDLAGKSIYTNTLLDAKKLLEEWKGAGKKSDSPQ